jgi:hypothetical protein
MSGHTSDGSDDYLAFLEAKDVKTLRDWALQVARDRRDVGFLWDLSRHLPDTEDLTIDLAALDPVDAVRELVHLFTHFRDEAASPEVAALLRARYIDYLFEHADDHRFDRPGPGATGG